MSNFISLEQAISMTSKFRSEKETILATSFQNEGTLPVCETFDKDAFAALLAKQGCESIRIYFGMGASDVKVRVIAVAVNSQGEDILPTSDLDIDFIVEDGFRCPTICPPSSALNED